MVLSTCAQKLTGLHCMQTPVRLRLAGLLQLEVVGEQEHLNHRALVQILVSCCLYQLADTCKSARGGLRRLVLALFASAERILLDWTVFWCAAGGWSTI